MAEPAKQQDDISSHLANERTYLAWVRTSVSTMGFGIVIAKLRYLLPYAPPSATTGKLIHAASIGMGLTIIGLVLLITSTWRFMTVRREIRESSYRSDSLVPLLLAVTIFSIGMIVIFYLLH